MSALLKLIDPRSRAQANLSLLRLVTAFCLSGVVRATFNNVTLAQCHISSLKNCVALLTHSLQLVLQQTLLELCYYFG